jgi:hypothetical protein
MTKIVVSVALAVLLLGGLLAGAGWFAAAVVAVAAATLVDLGGLFARAGARPVLVAAAIPAVGLPVAVALDPETAWDRLPAFVAAGFLAAVLLVLVFGRRRTVTAGLGATMAVALLVGLGAACLLLLLALPDGLRWVLGVGVVVAAADVSAAVPLRVLDDRRARADAFGDPPDSAGWLLGLLPLVAVAAAVALVTLALDPPLALRSAALLGLVALVAAVGGAQVHRSLAAEAGVALVDDRVRLGGGLVFSVVDAALLAAPAAYVLARSAAL